MAAKHLPLPHKAWKPRPPAAAMLSPEYFPAIVDAHEVVAVGRSDTWAGPVGEFLAKFVPANPEEAFA